VIWKSSHNKIILNELQVVTQPYVVKLYMSVQHTYFHMESVKHEKPDLNVCLPFVKCQPTGKRQVLIVRGFCHAYYYVIFLKYLCVCVCVCACVRACVRARHCIKTL